MSTNFYQDTPDIQFRLNAVDLEEAVRLREQGFTEHQEHPEAPRSYEEAVQVYDMVLGMVGELCARRIAPRAREVDAEGVTFRDGRVIYAVGTRASLEDLRNAQLMGVTLPRRYGGLNMPSTVYNMMMEMVSRADASLHNLVGLQAIADTVNRYGSEEQKARYLPLLASGEADGAMALTEPEAGSDLQAVQMRAWQDPDGRWYLNGVKQFITNGCARILLVLARSEEGSNDGRGLSLFVCESGPRLTVRRIEEKLGIHGSPTCELHFDDVPAELVGTRRRGLTRYVMSLMNGARVAVSAQALGIAEAALRAAVEYAAARRQFGRTIDRFPAVYEMLARSKAQILAARALLYETTRWVDLKDGYEDLAAREGGRLTGRARDEAKRAARIAAVLTPLSKAYSTEMANRVAYDSLQVHGGSGYMKEYDVERYVRDARVTNIYEGTTQLQHVAAMGGLVQGVLEPLMEEMSALPYEGRLRDLRGAVDEARAHLGRAVAHVNGLKDPEYHDLAARRLCQAQTEVFVGYLLLRDALADPRREAVAEYHVAEAIPAARADCDAVLRSDRTLIERREEILGL